jgi:hypothetical protein
MNDDELSTFERFETVYGTQLQLLQQCRLTSKLPNTKEALEREFEFTEKNLNYYSKLLHTLTKENKGADDEFWRIEVILLDLCERLSIHMGNIQAELEGLKEIHDVKRTRVEEKEEDERNGTGGGEEGVSGSEAGDDAKGVAGEDDAGVVEDIAGGQIGDVGKDVAEKTNEPGSGAGDVAKGVAGGREGRKRRTIKRKKNQKNKSKRRVKRRK